MFASVTAFIWLLQMNWLDLTATVEIFGPGTKRRLPIVELFGPIQLGGGGDGDDDDDDDSLDVDVDAAKIGLDHLRFFVSNIW